MDASMEIAIYTLLCAFALCVILCPIFIPLLQRLKFGQTIRDDGPKSHLTKAGTPTMGGIVIVLSFAIPTLIFGYASPDAMIILAITVLFGAVGFVDDFIKVALKRSLGLRFYQKIVAQLSISVGFAWYLYAHSDVGTAISVPFISGFMLDLGVWYYLLVIFVMVATVNGVNLTDGLDGLASGVTALVTTFFLFIAYLADSGSITALGAAVGALLGFLLFNSHPARVFMGDTGSLALGGFIGAAALILQMPLLIVIVGIVYVAESASVLLQVGYFKLSKGKRLFKCAPLHHHFEMNGWGETKVVATFYIVTAIMCLVGYLSVA